MDVARNLGQLKGNTQLVIALVRRQGRLTRRHRRAKTPVKATETVLAARPLAKRELASVGEAILAVDVAIGAGEGEPLAGRVVSSPLPGPGVDVADVESVGRVDRLARGTGSVPAELELALVRGHAVGVVLAVVVVGKLVAVLGLEGVAFA